MQDTKLIRLSALWDLRLPFLTFVSSSALMCLLASTNVLAQQVKRPDEQSDDVLRIKSELVQMPVIVSDKQGRFVPALTADDFELRVDGRPSKVDFLDFLSEGTPGQRIQMNSRDGKSTLRTHGGRFVIFFVDDRHLKAHRIERIRKTLLEFVETEMKHGDQIAVVSSSGAIGFLQQFADQKTVLRAAILRIRPTATGPMDTGNPPMSEYVAHRIIQGDRNALNYYTNDMLRSVQFTLALPKYGGKGPGFQVGSEAEQVQRIVMERAQAIVTASAANSIATLAALQSFLRSSVPPPGRKRLFFISDGFFLPHDNAFEREFQTITDAAVRSGCVIYTINAQAMSDISQGRETNLDTLGRVEQFSAGESSAAELPLTRLAELTGGRALSNSKTLAALVSDATREDANYYLLSWRPTSQEQQDNKFKRIQVYLRDRSDLRIRVANGLFMREQSVNSTSGAGTPRTVDERISLNVRPFNASAVPAVKRLETELSVGFLDIPKTGAVVTVSMQVGTDLSNYRLANAQQAIDIAGVVLNDQGKPSGGFRNRLNVNGLSLDSREDERTKVIYNYKVPLRPGIYQVRVVARDEKTDQSGYATSWIEVPDLNSRRFTLSSLFVGGRAVDSSESRNIANRDSEHIQFSVDNRFRQGSQLNFLVFIYNASKNALSATSLEAQATVVRNDQPVITSPVLKVPVVQGTDLIRIPYGMDIRLNSLSPGNYVLRIKIWDRLAGSSAEQQVDFVIE